ncbi:unnamed protein product, partial [Heterosigma akashiwo]
LANAGPPNNNYPAKMTMDWLERNVLCSEAYAVSFAMDIGLISSNRTCPFQGCGAAMQLKPRAGQPRANGGRGPATFIWKCKRSIAGQKHTCTRSIRDGSWFSKSNLTIGEILRFTFLWCNSCGSTTQASISGHSSATVCDWRNFCREVVQIYFIDNSQPIGGPGMIVEIDEAKFGKRKYNRGHRVEGFWVIGAVPESLLPGDQAPRQHRDADTLLPWIAANVRAGSTIQTDGWPAYNGIAQIPNRNYQHTTVVHAHEFVAADGTHTNSIESAWSKVRARIPRHGARKHFADGFLGEYIFQQKCRHGGLDPFMHFLTTVVLSIYAPP